MISPSDLVTEAYGKKADGTLCQADLSEYIRESPGRYPGTRYKDGRDTEQPCNTCVKMGKGKSPCGAFPMIQLDPKNPVHPPSCRKEVASHGGCAKECGSGTTECPTHDLGTVSLLK